MRLRCPDIFKNTILYKWINGDKNNIKQSELTDKILMIPILQISEETIQYTQSYELINEALSDQPEIPIEEIQQPVEIINEILPENQTFINEKTKGLEEIIEKEIQEVFPEKTNQSIIEETEKPDLEQKKESSINIDESVNQTKEKLDTEQKTSAKKEYVNENELLNKTLIITDEQKEIIKIIAIVAILVAVIAFIHYLSQKKK